MEEKKNLKQKLQEARMLLKEMKLKPSGYNDFTKSSYFSLGDILPSITDVCNKVGICPMFSYTNEATTLTIYDNDSDDRFDVTTPSIETEVKISSKTGKEISSKMQALAGNQTSMRRILLISTFDIVSEEDDEIKGFDINNHNLFEIKNRINMKLTELMKQGYSTEEICKKAGFTEKQYTQYMNCFEVINKIENNFNVLINDKSKLEN